MVVNEITDDFNFDRYKKVYFPFKDEALLKALELSKAYVCGGSVLQAIVGSPFYKLRLDDSQEVDIYVNLDNHEKILNYLKKIEPNIFDLSPNIEMISLYQPTPHDNEISEENHILQSLKFESKSYSRGIIINLFIVKNSTNLVKLLSDLDLSCSQTWFTVKANQGDSFSSDFKKTVYSTSISNIKKGECELNKKYVVRGLFNGNKKLISKLDQYTEKGFDIIIPSIKTSPTIYKSLNLKKYENYKNIYFEILANYINTKYFYNHSGALLNDYSHLYDGRYFESIRYIATKEFRGDELNYYNLNLDTFIDKENFNDSIEYNLEYMKKKYIKLFEYYNTIFMPPFVEKLGLVKGKYKNVSDKDNDLYYLRSFISMIYSFNSSFFEQKESDLIEMAKIISMRSSIQIICDTAKEIMYNSSKDEFIYINELPKILEMGTGCYHTSCDYDGNINMEELLNSDEADAVILKKMNGGEIKIIDVIEKSRIRESIQDENNSSAFFVCPEGFEGEQFTVRIDQVDKNQCFIKFNTLIGPQYIHSTDVTYMLNSPTKLFMFEEIYQEQRFINASLVVDQTNYNIFGGTPNAVSAIHCAKGSYIINKMYECNEPNEFYEDMGEKEKEIEKPTLEQLYQKYTGLKEIMESEDDFSKKVIGAVRLGLEGGDMQHITDYIRESIRGNIRGNIPVLEPQEDDYDPYLDGSR